MIKVTYLYHSGFAVETANHFLVFDYWRNTPAKGGLSDGVINPEELKDKNVIVFASHRHKDHYNEVIHSWQEVIKDCRIILSDDINSKDGALMVSPRGRYEADDYILRTFKSNDEGVAFLVTIDGINIYHAGDLNWWHWEGEKGSWNEDIKKSYIQEIDSIGNEVIDLAFVPLDPRLNLQYSWGLDYFMKTTNTNVVIPMHFGRKTEVIKRLLEDDISFNYRSRIKPLIARGESLTI